MAPGVGLESIPVVLNGRNIEHSHIDLIGFSISIAAKITSLCSPDKVLEGENSL